MRQAYIISAYKRPDLVVRLVETLRPCPVAIHVDRKSTILLELQQALASRPGVTFLPRHVCHWGMFGHVAASLSGLKWFLGTACDYAILLTGQCYPLKRQSDIAEDLAGLNGRSVLEHTAFPKSEWMQHDQGGYRRLRSFYVKLPFRAAPKALKLWTRQVPGGLHPFGGSSYWCLSRVCAVHVVRESERNPGLVRFFRRTLIPDEMFFQTVLANSAYRGELVDARTHYLDFSAGGSNPAVIGLESLNAAMASGTWFARKFEDHSVLDRADALRETGHPTPPPWQRGSNATYVVFQPGSRFSTAQS